MSDPVTNVEIEDVLSSIRRLVSSEDRPKPQEGTAQSPRQRDPDADRLVLTPSLRVDDTAPKEGTPDDVAPQDDNAALKARVAELEDVVSRQGDQWDPDGATDNANSGSPVASLPWEDYVPDGWEGSADADSPDPAAREAPPEAEDAPPDPATPPTDDSPENLIADGDTDLNRAEAQDAGDFLAGSDDFLDEDALRDLVADIVREELQGALGERITRNVRKLVRREIHRALASQELQ